MSLTAQLLLLPLLIGLNAFFVIAEYALVAIRPSQIESIRARGGNAAAVAMSKLRADLPGALGTIQVCITMTNLLLGWLGEPAMSAVLQRALNPLGVFLPENVGVIIAAALSFIIVTLLTVVLSELVPKALTLQYTVLLARLTAVPVLTLRQLLQPIVWLMNRMGNFTTRALGLGPVQIEGQVHTIEEIRLIAAEAGEAGALTMRERSLVLNSLSFGRKRAHDIMVPRVHVAFLDLRKSLAENNAIVQQQLFSRLPLCDGSLDKVIGWVYTKEFLTACQEDADANVMQLIARPAVFVPVTVALDRLLNVFKERQTHLLFLVDEYGGVEGIVTLTDVVDELLGEMPE